MTEAPRPTAESPTLDKVAETIIERTIGLRGPATEAGRALMGQSLQHQAYCYVKQGGAELLKHPERCICPLKPSILAIEAEAAALSDSAPDNPEYDGTDAAHPAWWRGSDHTAKVMEQAALSDSALREALERVLWSGHTNVNLEGFLCRCVVHEDARALLAQPTQADKP